MAAPPQFVVRRALMHATETVMRHAALMCRVPHHLRSSQHWHIPVRRSASTTPTAPAAATAASTAASCFT